MFTTALLLTNYYLNFKFFQALRSALLKNEIKNILKKDGSHLKIAWQLIIARDRSKTFKKRERKTKNEKKSNKSFFTFTFLYRKIYILLENILRKTQFILLHLHYRIFTRQVIGNGNRLGILRQILIAMDYFFYLSVSDKYLQFRKKVY